MGWSGGSCARAAPLKGFTVGGVHLGECHAGLVVTGTSGYGKTFFSRSIQEQAIMQDMVVIVACCKPTEASEIEALCRRLGCLDRFVRLRPNAPERINLLKYLVESPGGSTLGAAQFLSRLNDIASRAEGTGRHGEAFWMTMFETALICAIELCILGSGEADMEYTKDALISSPDESTEVESFLAGESDCAMLLKAARVRSAGDPAKERRFKRCEEFLLKEFRTMGAKARGAVLAMVNAILGRFLMPPFYEALCDESTFTPEIAAQRRSVVALDYDLLTYETPGRMFQLAWIMMMQGYGLRRDPANAPTILICRDECAYFTHPDYDARVQAVARSQKLCHFDLFQDFDLMEATYGGGPKAKSEVSSFYSNHSVKFAFHQDHMPTAEVHSSIAGSYKEVMISGGSPHQPTDMRDRILGVASMPHWSEQYQRVLRPEFFATLPVGVCVMQAQGQTRIVDLRERR